MEILNISMNREKKRTNHAGSQVNGEANARLKLSWKTPGLQDTDTVILVINVIQPQLLRLLVLPKLQKTPESVKQPEPGSSGTEQQRQQTESEQCNSPVSASKRKLNYFSDSSSTATDTCDEETDASKMGDDEFVIISMEKLKDISKGALYPNCFNSDLRHDAYNCNQGMVVHVTMQCQHCLHKVTETYTSKRVDDRGKSHHLGTYECHKRCVAAFNTMGSGYAGYRTFSMMMNMPAMSERSYISTSAKVNKATMEAGDVTLQEAVQVVRNTYLDMDDTLAPDSIIDVAISFDGTWMKRGHKSMYGVACVIELQTGLVVDYHVMSKYCLLCSRNTLDTNSDEYKQWYNEHKQECAVNYEGSSGGMEQEAGEILWSRSVDRNRMRYTVMLSDGDTKTYDHLTSLDIYGGEHEITKEECVNHVAKRMGTALRKVRTNASKTKGLTLGGRGHGKLTDPIIAKLTKYYGRAIRENVGDADAMAQAVQATLFHVSSTDETPKHQLCPDGENSWCFYKRAEATGESQTHTKKKHENSDKPRSSKRNWTRI